MNKVVKPGKKKSSLRNKKTTNLNIFENKKKDTKKKEGDTTNLHVLISLSWSHYLFLHL